MRHRLLVVARRFWPLCDESSQRLLAWGTTLRQEGIEVTILTGRWNTSWPAQSQIQELNVVRLLPPPKSSWNETVFLRNVALWVGKNLSEFDSIYVDESAALLHQIVQTNPAGNLPIICRFGGIPFDVLKHPYYMNMLKVATDACRRVRRVIVPHVVAQKQLLAAGVHKDQILRIADMPWQPIVRQPDRRSDAARALREINSDLHLNSKVPLLLYFGVPDEPNATEYFLRAAIRLLEQDYLVRIWMLGVGRRLAQLYDLVKFEAYHRDIYFHGVFDSVEELFQVADGLMVLPGAGLEYLAPQAIASGLPILSTSSPEALAVLPPIMHPYLGPDFTMMESVAQGNIALGGQSHGNPAMEKAIEGYHSVLKHWLDQPSQWAARARTVKQDFIQSNALQENLRAWILTLRGLDR